VANVSITDEGAPTGSTANGELGLVDPMFNRIDWDSIMDDFEWNPSSDYMNRA
jgi:hypothetical protein